jgi:glycosyltransferase involved in cell wall biosynthesis
VAADTGGLREVVPRDVGLRFRTEDVAALARTIERVLVDAGLRDRLIAEGREHVLRFDWTDVARTTAALYGELHAPQRV